MTPPLAASTASTGSSALDSLRSSLERAQDTFFGQRSTAGAVDSVPAPATTSGLKANVPASRLSFLAPPITQPPVAMLGVPFDHVTAAGCLRWIESAIASRRSHYVVTANVDFLVQARFDVELRRILLDAHLVLCDGTPLVWASRLLGNPLPERVAGADVVPALIQVAAEKGYRLFFLGATEDSCKRAVETLTGVYPQLAIAGHYSPPFNKLLEMDHQEITRRIREAKPDLLFVCFGCPKQEKWMTMHYRNLGVPVSIGLGATIDFIAGQVRRAPLWMQQMGLEWTFRLAQEPRRLFRRYLKDFCVFAWAITAQWWRLQFRSCALDAPRKLRSIRSAPAEREETATFQTDFVSTGSNGQTQGQAWQLHKLPACLDAGAIVANVAELDAILNEPSHCLLDASAVRFTDSTGIGSLARLQQKLWSTGRQLVLVAPSRRLRRALRLSRLHDFVAFACDVPTALQIIESRTREQAAAVTRRTAAAINPLAWHGEITAANADSVWAFTREHINTLCDGWKTIGPSKSPANGHGNNTNDGHHQNGKTNPGNGVLSPARGRTESHPALDALKLRILTPPSLPRRKVIIDLSHVRFIDSTGLGLMVRARKLAAGHGAHLVFTGLQPTVRNVIRIARLEQHLLTDPPINGVEPIASAA